MEFSQIQLNEKLQANIKNYTNDSFEGFNSIQMDIIKSEQENKNLMIISSAGTGKTFACVVSILNNIEKYTSRQIIFLEPNIGHLQQVYNMVSELGKDIPVHVFKYCVGVDTNDFVNQITNTLGSIQIIVSSPSKFSQILNNESKLFVNITKLFIDECEESIQKYPEETFQLINQIKMNLENKICIMSPVLYKENNEKLTEMLDDVIIIRQYN